MKASILRLLLLAVTATTAIFWQRARTRCRDCKAGFMVERGIDRQCPNCGATTNNRPALAKRY